MAVYLIKRGQNSYMINKPYSETPEQLKVFHGRYMCLLFSLLALERMFCYTRLPYFLLSLEWLMVTPQPTH